MPLKEDEINLLDTKPNNANPTEVTIFTKVITPTKNQEIQALRGIAILSVLLFHISPNTFTQGFFGVDIFFVISGYLMCSILSKHKCLDFHNVFDFYFRRLKRIAPIYTFTILLILTIAIVFILHPIDYEQIPKDIWKTLIFCSNIPEKEDKGYFKQDQNVQHFFLHLWSLAVEVQFYLIVPFLMITLNSCHNFLKFLVILLLICLSFLFQLNSSGDQEHMNLLSRIWQFQVGFLAFYIKDSKIITNLFNFTKFESVGNNKILIHVIDSILSLLLVSFLFIQILPQKQFNRLFVMIFTFILMSRKSEYKILCLRSLIELGNVSYSVYLIHWPLIELHKYTLMYENITVISIEAKIFLIFLSVLIGFLIEKSWEKVFKFIDSWKSLFVYILIVYFLILDAVFYLNLNKWDAQLLSSSMQKVENPLKITNDAILMWKNEFPDEIDAQTAVSYNLKFNQLFVDLSYCPNPNRSVIPTNFNLSRIGFGDVIKHAVGITTSCVTEGNGTKNIVMFGNSHARAAHFGVEYNFRDIYKHLTEFSLSACDLIHWKGHTISTKEHQDACDKFKEYIFEILEKWKHPIDIIIVAHAYYYTKESNELPFLNKETDKNYQDLETLFSKLGKIAKEVVLFSGMLFNTTFFDQTRLTVKKVLNKEKLDVFKIPYNVEHSYFKNTRNRIDAITCPNCVLLNWEDIWCNKTTKICDSVDQKHKISYFYDYHHVNTYGSLKVGEYVRKRYNEWSRNKAHVH